MSQVLRDIEYLKTFNIGVYGDDSITGIYFTKKMTDEMRDEFKAEFTQLAKKKFFMRCKAEDTRLCLESNKRIKIKIPVFNDYTRDKLIFEETQNKKPSNYILKETYGYLMDYNKGIPHRWSYHFNDSPCFLKIYFDPDYLSINLANYTYERLLHSDRHVKSSEQHRELLLQHATNNSYI